MDFHTLFPNTVVFIVPVFKGNKIVDDLLYHLTFFICLNHTRPTELEFNNQVKYFANRIVLTVPPLFPIFFKGLWMEASVNVLPRFVRLVFNGPIDFVFVFYKKSQESLGGLLHHREISSVEKPQGHKVNVSEPGFIVAGLYVVSGGSEHTSRFLE